MLKKLLYPCAFLLSTLIIVSCSEESNPKFDSQSFTHIYDNASFTSSFHPIDIVQTADGGYIFLNAEWDTTQFTYINLLKVDKSGHYVSELSGGGDFRNAVGRLTVIGDSCYFFCMDEGANAYLASVDVGLTAMKTRALGLRYPAVSTFNTTDGFILQSYNDDARESVLSTISTTGVIRSKGFNVGVGDDLVDEVIQNNFLRSGKKLPMEVGKVSSGQYFFTGFYNYTFSLIFTDMNADDPTGVVNGSQDDGGYSSIVPISGNKFAGSRFNFGDNYFLPNTLINLTGDQIETGFAMPELVSNAKVKILRATINAKNVLIYASDTKSRQIGLFFYDEATGVFISSRYLGFSNPFEVSNLITTADGGIAICGTTYLAGRFPRVCIFKLSEKEINSNVK